MGRSRPTVVEDSRIGGTVECVSGELDERVVVSAYDDSWPDRFEREKERLLGDLEDAVLAIEHIGSTAVPGLDAKPIVDVLIGVAGPPGSRAIIDRVRALGYESFGEAGVPGRLYFRRRLPDAAFNVHVVERESTLWCDNLLLRDYLRTHPKDAAEYAAAKRRAASAAPDSLLQYSKLKSPALDVLLIRARKTPSAPHPSDQR